MADGSPAGGGTSPGPIGVRGVLLFRVVCFSSVILMARDLLEMSRLRATHVRLRVMEDAGGRRRTRTSPR